MASILQGDQQLNSLLSSFEDPNASQIIVKPNIKMTIKSSNSQFKSNNGIKTGRIVKCNGKLQKQGSKMVPNVQCSSMKVNTPVSNRTKSKKQNFGTIIE